MSPRARSAATVSALVTLAYAPSTLASGKIIEAEPLSGTKISIDGLIRDWPGKMTDLGGAGGDPSASGQFGYDDTSIYVAFKVKDAKIGRTTSAGSDDDHAQLALAFPKGGTFVTYLIDLYPGVPGKMSGVVKVGGKTISSAKIVEAPVALGFTLEAKLPWSTFAEAATTRVGLRGALRYFDSDGSGTKQLETGSGSGGSLPGLLLEAEQALETSLLRPNSLPQKPSLQAYGDLVGDSFKERVGVWGKYLAIVGPRYKGGTQFYFRELGVESASMVTRLELFDADGDGKQEILVVRRLGASTKYREIVTVIKVGTNEQPYEAFNHEVAVVTADVKIQNTFKLVSKGKTTSIEIAQGTAEGADPATYAEETPTDMDATLLPWQSVGKQIYDWSSTAYGKSKDETWQPKVAAPGTKRVRKRDTGPPPPPPPRPPTPDELLDRVYALYRKDRGVGTQKPRFDFVTDVAGGTEPERVLVHSTDVVIFGKGFKGGMSYAFITINVKDPSDVVHVDARDLTGDGKAEVIVRMVLPTKTSKELGGKVVKRHAMVVYTVTETGLRRIFGAETGRELEGNGILGSVAFLPAGHGTAIELRSNRAVGWTEQDYPFPQDTLPAGGLEPLLLPWTETKKNRYAFDGNGFVKK